MALTSEMCSQRSPCGTETPQKMLSKSFHPQTIHSIAKAPVLFVKDQTNLLCGSLLACLSYFFSSHKKIYPTMSPAAPLLVARTPGTVQLWRCSHGMDFILTVLFNLKIFWHLYSSYYFTSLSCYLCCDQLLYCDHRSMMHDGILIIFQVCTDFFLKCT